MMKAARRAKTQGRDERLVQVSLYRNVTLRKQYALQTPGWRRPIIGYLASIPLVGFGVTATIFLQQWLGTFYFQGSFLMMAVLFVALFWGVGSALFSVVLSCVMLDYFIIPPLNQFKIIAWQGVVQLIPFLIAGLTVAIITGQRERARLQTLATEQELQGYAEDLEEANEKLKETNQLKDQFISVASHELKTPTTTIRGQAQLALRRLSKQRDLTPEMEGVRVALEKINDQTGRLTSLVDELLDLSSVRAGKLQLQKKDCNLVDICREAVEDQHLLSGRPIELDAPDKPVKVQGDKDRLAQVVVNLVSNAVKYTPEGSPVRVCVHQGNKVGVIEVQDHGKGIAKEQQAHIFDTFYRTPDAQSSAKFGLGLGLSICKDIVERHGGRIWVESEEGKGSTFCVELPQR